MQREVRSPHNCLWPDWVKYISPVKVMACTGFPWLPWTNPPPWPACRWLYKCTVDRLCTTDSTHVLWTDCTHVSLAYSGCPGPEIAMASPGCPWSPAAKDTKDRIWRGWYVSPGLSMASSGCLWLPWTKALLWPACGRLYNCTVDRLYTIVLFSMWYISTGLYHSQPVADCNHLLYTIWFISVGLYHGQPWLTLDTLDQSIS